MLEYSLRKLNSTLDEVTDKVTDEVTIEGDLIQIALHKIGMSRTIDLIPDNLE